MSKLSIVGLAFLLNFCGWGIYAIIQDNWLAVIIYFLGSATMIISWEAVSRRAKEKQGDD